MNKHYLTLRRASWCPPIARCHTGTVTPVQEFWLVLHPQTSFPITDVSWKLTGAECFSDDVPALWSFWLPLLYHLYSVFFEMWHPDVPLLVYMDIICHFQNGSITGCSLGTIIVLLLRLLFRVHFLWLFHFPAWPDTKLPLTLLLVCLKISTLCLALPLIARPPFVQLVVTFI